jgi:hypothetical protein
MAASQSYKSNTSWDGEDKDIVERELDRLGEEEVRLRLQFHVFDEEQAHRAHDWLSEREHEAFGDNLRSLRGYALQTNEVARKSHGLSQIAHDMAMVAEACAREARGRAEQAEARADAAVAQLRRLSNIGAVALLAASLASSICAVLLAIR